MRPDVPRILCLAYNLLSPIFIAVVKELSIPPFQLHVLIHIRHLFALSCPFVSHSGCSSYTLSFLFAYHHSLHEAISWIYIGSLSPLQQKKESFRVCVCAGARFGLTSVLHASTDAICQCSTIVLFLLQSPSTSLNFLSWSFLIENIPTTKNRIIAYTCSPTLTIVTHFRFPLC